MERIQMQRIIDGVRYDTEKATLIAHDVFWDGHNFERHGRNVWLYRTPNGRYFTVRGTLWQGVRDTLTPLSPEEARQLYERLPEQESPYEEAFPGMEIIDA